MGFVQDATVCRSLHQCVIAQQHTGVHKDSTLRMTHGCATPSPHVPAQTTYSFSCFPCAWRSLTDSQALCSQNCFAHHDYVHFLAHPVLIRKPVLLGQADNPSTVSNNSASLQIRLYCHFGAFNMDFRSSVFRAWRGQWCLFLSHSVYNYIGPCRGLLTATAALLPPLLWLYPNPACALPRIGQVAYSA